MIMYNHQSGVERDAMQVAEKEEEEDGEERFAGAWVPLWRIPFAVNGASLRWPLGGPATVTSRYHPTQDVQKEGIPTKGTSSQLGAGPARSAAQHFLLHPRLFLSFLPHSTPSLLQHPPASTWRHVSMLASKPPPCHAVGKSLGSLVLHHWLLIAHPHAVASLTAVPRALLPRFLLSRLPVISSIPTPPPRNHLDSFAILV